jgi:hypothetical protein
LSDRKLLSNRNNNNNNNNSNNDSIRIYLRANLAAQRPVTESAGVRRKKQQQNATNTTETGEFI